MLQLCYEQGFRWDNPPLYMGGRPCHAMPCHALLHLRQAHTADTPHRPSISTHTLADAPRPPPCPGLALGVVGWMLGDATPTSGAGRDRTATMD